MTAMEIIRQQAFIEAADYADGMARQIEIHAIGCDEATVKVIGVVTETLRMLSEDLRRKASAAVRP